MTASNRAYWDYRRTAEAAHKDYCAVVLQEFQPGQRVEWTHTFKVTADNPSTPVKRSGTVTAVETYGRVTVQGRPGGPTKTMDAYLLEILK